MASDTSGKRSLVAIHARSRRRAERDAGGLRAAAGRARGERDVGHLRRAFRPWEGLGGRLESTQTEVNSKFRYV